ncbi:MAG: protein kinase [Agathobacter sp.]|nr:protein kinase [Agathobacter sp.]MDY4894192.1 serine/threonine-protein kinase [Agathobacter sp.]
MNENDFVGKIIRDVDGREYHITSVLNKGGQGVVYRTAEDFLIKVNTATDREKYRERYKWLKKRGAQLPKETRIAFPMAILEEPFVGYVMKEAKGHVSLNDYVEKPEEIEDLWDWYFNATGGLTKRLQIGYLLAKSLRYLHINGYAYVDISPSNIFVSREKNSLAIIDSDNITSGAYKPLIDGTNFYMAPEIGNKSSVANTMTDTYSYAVLLFKMLTTCHPFIGDDAEDENPEKLQEEVDTGKKVYIGDPDFTENRNSNFENTKIFLTEELTELFRRTFVDGKLESSRRPTLMEFMRACAHARNIVIQCDHEGCDADYYYTGKDCICPMCGEHIKKVYLLTSRNMVRTRGKILIPLDGSSEMKPLDVYSDITGNMAITKEMKYINRSFFDENIPFDADGSLAAVGRTNGGNLAVLNLSNNKIVLNDARMSNPRLVQPYKKGVTKPVIIDEKPGNYFMFLDKNIDVTTESDFIDIKQIERFYGTTEISKFIQIRQEE